MLLYLSHLILYTWQVAGVGAGLLRLFGRAHPLSTPPSQTPGPGRDRESLTLFLRSAQQPASRVASLRDLFSLTIDS